MLSIASPLLRALLLFDVPFIRYYGSLRASFGDSAFGNKEEVVFVLEVSKLRRLLLLVVLDLDLS